MSSLSIVWGMGHIGLITASFLYEKGNVVFGVDRNAERLKEISELNFSPRSLVKIVSSAIKSERLNIGTMAPQIENCQKGITHFICVDTPTLNDGTQDISNILSVLRSIVNIGLKKDDLVVIRSTVLPFTTQNIILPFLQDNLESGGIKRIHLVTNPSFSRHYEYEEDLLKSDRIIIGAESNLTLMKLIELYAIEYSKIISMSYAESELTKYADNCFHALKITFANEVNELASSGGQKGSNIMNALCADKRLNISEKYLEAGLAYDGKCIPKDLRAITNYIAKNKLELPLISNIDNSNNIHHARISSNLKLKTVG